MCEGTLIVFVSFCLKHSITYQLNCLYLYISFSHHFDPTYILRWFSQHIVGFTHVTYQVMFEGRHFPRGCGGWRSKIPEVVPR